MDQTVICDLIASFRKVIRGDLFCLLGKANIEALQTSERLKTLSSHLKPNVSEKVATKGE